MKSEKKLGLSSLPSASRPARSMSVTSEEAGSEASIPPGISLFLRCSDKTRGLTLKKNNLRSGLLSDVEWCPYPQLLLHPLYLRRARRLLHQNRNQLLEQFKDRVQTSLRCSEPLESKSKMRMSSFPASNQEEAGGEAKGRHNDRRSRRREC